MLDFEDFLGIFSLNTWHPIFSCNIKPVQQPYIGFVKRF